MNAYLLTGIAMCLVVLIALAATAYLAVFFNRRAKADLEAALAPLAAEVDGSIDLDEAEVSGTYDGFPVFARMANASEGPGRVFQTDVLDSAGGTAWQYTSNPVSRSAPERTVTFTGAEDVKHSIEPLIDAGARSFLDAESERYRVEYLVEKGFIRLVRAMRTRRDIPEADVFVKQLDMLTGIANANRAYMESGAVSTGSVSKEPER